MITPTIYYFLIGGSISIKFDQFCLYWSCFSLTGHAAAWPVEGVQLKCRQNESNLIKASSSLDCTKPAGKRGFVSNNKPCPPFSSEQAKAIGLVQATSPRMT